MPVIQKDIVIPDKIFGDYLKGNVDICGLAKNVDNGRIVKHLDAFDTNDENSNATIIATVAVITTVAITSATAWIVNIISKKKVTHFKEALNAYIFAVNEKQLTISIIDELIESLDKLKGKARKSITVEFSSAELTALIECLCNHTQTLADANNINLQFKTTDEEKQDILLRFRNNLVKQKEIFDLVA